MKSSFSNEDITFLLKDITGLVEPLSTKIREEKIQAGIHYSEMLPLEYQPTKDYIGIYENALSVFGQSTADAVARVSDLIYQRKGKNVVLVSLARAGSPIGVLIKRYIKKKYGISCPHYSISIIRDKGIDRNAMRYILTHHAPQSLQFVDGWTGKGVIYKELKKELGAFKGVSDELAVLADPANVTDLCGTHDDIMIPSSCLNSTVCGLVSRTFFRTDIIGENDFHGAAYYGDLCSEDRTYQFINSIVNRFRYDLPFLLDKRSHDGCRDILMLTKKYQIENASFIKPGIGETTRVLLRRVPWKVIIDKRYIENSELSHIIQLAKERNVGIELTNLENYKCCGVIKQLSDV